MGRFFDKDHLVLLNAYDKHELVKKTYEVAEKEVIAAWDAIFGARRPFSGAEFSDYMSGGVFDVDEKI